jgi:integrase
VPRNTSDNLRVKRRYLLWLAEAKGLSEASIDKAAAAIDRWTAYVGGADFRRFHTEKAVAFKRALERERTEAGSQLSPSSREAILRELKAFFLWLADQPGFRAKIRHADAAWFTPDRRDARAAHQGQWRPHPSPEQMQAAVRNMIADTVFARRDRALVAFLYLTGCRETAAMTLRLRHIDLANRCVQFDGRDVRTKFGKRFTTFFFPVGEDIAAIFSDWVRELREDRLFGPDDPLFPKTEVRRATSGLFEPADLARIPWSSAGPIALAFKEAFKALALPPFSPHTVRKTLTDLASQHCRTPEEFKAWSQNLGHDEVLTTFHNYGTLSPGRQRELIQGFSARVKPPVGAKSCAP